MKIHGGVEMLAMVVALFLALGVSDSAVVDKCELGKQLNLTLPGNLLNQFSNLLAKIVCHVELSSHFNTSTISYVTGPSIPSFIPKDQGKRKGRSAESGIMESSEEDTDSSDGAGHRRRTTSETSSMESSEEESNSSDSAGHRSSSSSRSRSEESSEENIQVPKHGSHFSTANPVTRLQRNNSARGGGRQRSASESSSDESSDEDSDSSDGASRQRRSSSKNGESSSQESSSKESNERNRWILYGLFQLPEGIACTSGLDPSLKLCNMTCDELIDDKIGDDINCFETILNNTLSAGTSHGPTQEHFRKLYHMIFQKECANVKDSKYFSTCS